MGDKLERREKLTGEIRQRLQKVCQHLSETDFQELVDKIADNYMKSDARSVRFGSETAKGKGRTNI